MKTSLQFLPGVQKLNVIYDGKLTSFEDVPGSFKRELYSEFVNDQEGLQYVKEKTESEGAMTLFGHWLQYRFAPKETSSKINITYTLF